MRVLGPRLGCLVLLCGLGVSCGEDEISLFVDLRTDYAPGLLFASVRTEHGSLASLRGTAVAPGAIEVGAAEGDDFLGGRRVAELDGLSEGTVAVKVTLLDRRGALVASRITTVELSGSYALTVLITADCDATICPGPMDPGTAVACVNGRCVDPACSPEAPSACGDPDCAASAHCPAPDDCGEGRCVEGRCFVRVDHAACASPTLYCHPIDGCTPRDPVADGGACGAAETRCADGADDDCDTLVDCADPECTGPPCTCTSDAHCDDGDGCTDDVCDLGAGTCAHPPNAAACDDGLFCNGPDRCAGGACADHPSPPCEASRCDEGTDACGGCATDGDCGAPVPGAWGGCGGFADACDTTGTQTRTVTVPRCVSAACTATMTMESQPCTRTVAEGTSCGGTSWHVCCGGACRDTRSDTSHCGACGVSCASQGLACAATGSGGYGCRGCTANSQCQSILSGTATCWDVAAPPAFCQCQCGSDGVCANAGCGAGMFCHDCSGHNFCAPFGGSC